MPTYLLLTRDGNGTGSWGMFHSCGGMGVGRDPNGMGWDGTSVLYGGGGEEWRNEGKKYGGTAGHDNGEYMGLRNGTREVQAVLPLHSRRELHHMLPGPRGPPVSPIADTDHSTATPLITSQQ